MPEKRIGARATPGGPVDSAADVYDSIPVDAIRGQIDRICSSEIVMRSARLVHFLRFVGDWTLAGRSDELKETTVAMEVFDRSADYDPKLDTIVRTQAWRLRAKLKQYYEVEGRTDVIAVELPRGSYVPTFHEREPVLFDYRPGKTLSHFRLLEKVGEGASGIVFKAEDTKLHRVLALKFISAGSLLDEDLKSRFLREAEAAAALNHPNICTIYEVDEIEGQNFIAMAYEQGRSLDRLLEAGPMGIEDSLEIAWQAALGLQAAHEKGVIHRDVKPPNLLIGPNIGDPARVKIIDFGLAQLAGRSRVTLKGTAVGTASYISPEQMRGEGVDHRTDIWSLGAVLYEMLTGERPFTADHREAIFYAIANKAPEPVRAIRAKAPEVLEQIVARCLQKDPGQRYRNMAEVLDDLASHKAGEKTSSPSIARVAREPEPAVPSIAVLPFVNKGGGPDSEHLADGLAEDIINELAQVEDLRVVGRSSAFQFRGSRKSNSEIGRELRARTLLEGTVRRSGDRVRITVEHVNAADGYQLWSRRFDRSLEDILDLQAEIARRVAEEFKLHITSRGHRFADANAYELFLKGRQSIARQTPDKVEQGIQLLGMSASAEPGNADVYAELALGHIRCGMYAWVPSQEAWPEAEKQAHRSLELNSEHGLAHACLGAIRAVQHWNWSDSRSEFEKAIECSPNAALIRELFTRWCLWPTGCYQEALEHTRKAIDLDPLSVETRISYAGSLIFNGLPEDAIRDVSKNVKLFPEVVTSHWGLANVCRMAGRDEKALEAYSKAVELAPDSGMGLAFLTMSLARNGLVAEARRRLDDLLKLEDAGRVQPVHMAVAYSALGDIDEAFRQLDLACEMRNQFLFYAPVRGFVYPELEADPRYERLLRKMGLDARVVTERRPEELPPKMDPIRAVEEREEAPPIPAEKTPPPTPVEAPVSTQSWWKWITGAWPWR